jgi:glycosyltransferase 2 family protein
MKERSDRMQEPFKPEASKPEKHPTTPASLGPESASKPVRKRWKIIGAIASGLLFAVAIVVLVVIIRDLDAEKVKGAFAAASGRQIALAALLTCISYLMLTGYDALALRHIGAKVSYAMTALASFTSYAVSFTLGFPLLTAGTVRFWIYAPSGLSASMIASLTVIAGITFWLGMGTVLGVGLIWQASSIAEINRLAVWANVLIGFGILVAAAGYLGWVSLKRRSITVQGWTLSLPGLQVTFWQMLLGAVDVCCAGGVLYVLLPAGHGLNFETFLAAYVFAVILGIASHAPGGLGVFETTLLLALPSFTPEFTREGLLGALLLYRLCYYLIPFILALALLGAREVYLRWGALRRALEKDETRARP